ncbi:MAG: hypothetical protein M3158_00705 [Pseudomonadota bacterium]|nr:hypothetical protein [Pseudomonadota bacterium]
MTGLPVAWATQAEKSENSFENHIADAFAIGAAPRAPQVKAGPFQLYNANPA